MNFKLTDETLKKDVFDGDTVDCHYKEKGCKFTPFKFSLETTFPNLYVTYETNVGLVALGNPEISRFLRNGWNDIDKKFFPWRAFQLYWVPCEVNASSS
jgi:hypothetical protein